MTAAARDLDKCLRCEKAQLAGLWASGSHWDQGTSSRPASYLKAFEPAETSSTSRRWWWVHRSSTSRRWWLVHREWCRRRPGKQAFSPARVHQVCYLSGSEQALRSAVGPELQSSGSTPRNETRRICGKARCLPRSLFRLLLPKEPLRSRPA